MITLNIKHIFINKILIIMKTLKHFIFILLFLITFSQQNYSQESDTLNSEGIITSFKLTEIPIEIEKTTSLIALEISKLKESQNVDEVKKRFQILSSNFNAQKSKLDSLDLAEQTSGKIKELLRHWQIIENDVSQLLGDITDQTTFLESQKAKFKKLGNVWKATIANADKESTPVDLINAMKTLQGELKNINKLVTDELNTLLVIQTDLSKHSIQTENVITSIMDIDNINRRNILTQNALPLWKIGSDSTQAKSVAEEFNDILISYKTAYSEFIVTYEESIPIYIFTFFIFFAFVLYLKVNSKKIESDDKKLEQSLVILKHPLSATLLIFGIMMTFFYGDAPAAFKSIVKIVLLIPLVRILVKIINPKMISR